ncbi:hypothetical protein Bca101_098810 [Brassica carinata]
MWEIYSEVLDKVESFVVNDSSDEIDKARRAVVVMCLGISSAFWFTRCNLIGPTDQLMKCSLPFKVLESKELVEWENWAKIQLMSAGSDLLGKFSNLQRSISSLIVAVKEFDMTAEMLMRQLLKLDGIKADGEARVQRKAEVRRVQKLQEDVDTLKARCYRAKPQL